MRRKRKILIVDDEEFVRAAVRRILEFNNYSIIEALSGPEALKKLSEKPDLIIADYHLGGMSGLCLLIEIRKASDIPIIMLTADSSQKIAVQWFREGGNDFIHKPFDSDFLLVVVERTLRYAAAMRAMMSQPTKTRKPRSKRSSK
ncbi:MAG: response regulator [Nitrospirota bacterium]